MGCLPGRERSWGNGGGKGTKSAPEPTRSNGGCG